MSTKEVAPEETPTNTADYTASVVASAITTANEGFENIAVDGSKITFEREGIEYTATVKA